MTGEWLDPSSLAAPKGYAPGEAAAGCRKDPGPVLQLTSRGRRLTEVKPLPCYQPLWSLVLQAVPQGMPHQAIFTVYQMCKVVSTISHNKLGTAFRTVPGLYYEKGKVYS